MKLHDSTLLKEAALRHVNKALVALGHNPLEAIPPGQQHSGEICAIANAFATALPQPVRVNHLAVTFYDAGDALSVRQAWTTSRFGCLKNRFITKRLACVPSELAAFIIAFDDGQYPELVIDDLTSSKLLNVYSLGKEPFQQPSLASGLVL